MKVKLNHPELKERVQKYSRLADFLRKSQCAQADTGVWVPEERAIRACRYWAATNDYVLEQHDNVITITLRVG